MGKRYMTSFEFGENNNNKLCLVCCCCCCCCFFGFFFYLSSNYPLLEFIIRNFIIFIFIHLSFKISKQFCEFCYFAALLWDEITDFVHFWLNAATHCPNLYNKNEMILLFSWWIAKKMTSENWSGFRLFFPTTIWSSLKRTPFRRYVPDPHSPAAT